LISYYKTVASWALCSSTFDLILFLLFCSIIKTHSFIAGSLKVYSHRFMRIIGWEKHVEFEASIGVGRFRRSNYQNLNLNLNKIIDILGWLAWHPIFGYKFFVRSIMILKNQ